MTQPLIRSCLTATTRPFIFWLALGLLCLPGMAVAQESRNDTSAPQTRPAAVAETDIVPVNDSGAWTWFNDPRAIVLDDRFLLVGSVDAEGYSRVDLFDLESRRPVPGGGFRLSTITQTDDHNNPALLRLDDGRILAAWSRHGNDRFWSFRFGTFNPEQPVIDWSEEHRYDIAAGSTYCNLFQLSQEDGRVYNFVRALNFNPNVVTSDDAGQSWSEPAILFHIGNGRVRPYVKYASDGQGRIDFLFTEGHPRDVRTGILHAYYENGTLHHTDGSAIAPMPGPDADPVEPTAATRIYDGSQQRAWVWDIAYQPDGSPVAVFMVAADDNVGEDLRYHYARWDAQQGKWIDREFAHAGRYLYKRENHYAGGVTLDPEHPGVVYFSSNVDPKTGELNETGHYQIYRGRTTDGRATWQFEQLTHTLDADNLRPYVPRRHPLDTCLLWFRGNYDTYANYDTRIVGLFK